MVRASQYDDPSLSDGSGRLDRVRAGVERAVGLHPQHDVAGVLTTRRVWR